MPDVARVRVEYDPETGALSLAVRFGDEDNPENFDPNDAAHEAAVLMAETYKAIMEADLEDASLH